MEGWCNYTEDLRKLNLKPVVKKVKRHPVNIRASLKAQELVSLVTSRRQGCEGGVGREVDLNRMAPNRLLRRA